MKITKRGKYQTRDGRKVRIYAVDGGGTYPIHGAVLCTTRKGIWMSMDWTKEGRVSLVYVLLSGDLIPAPKRKRGGKK